jgi:hypothetical protein
MQRFRSSFPRPIACLLILLSVLGLALPGLARDAREDKRITALIQSVETLKGSTFIRNGKPYDAAEAADHLRLKLKNVGERVKTAEDFIIGCASKSSFSGRKYRIRLAGGEEMDAEKFFRQKLREIDARK